MTTKTPQIDPAIPDLRRKRTTNAQWIRKFLEHGPYCHYCSLRLTLDTAVKEHLTPLCRGGADVIENIVPACAPCNDMKAWRTEEEFIRDRPMLLARRTAARTIASPGAVRRSLEEVNEPGLLKKLTAESDRVSWAWRNPA